MAVSGARVWDAAYLDGRTPRRRPARIMIGGEGLEISLTEDGGSLRWPLREIRQTQGFYPGEQVRLERGTMGEALLIADVAFLTALRAAVPEAARGFHDPARRRWQASVAVGAVLAALVVSLALYFWGIPALAGVAADHVPVSWEVALGESAVARLAPPSRRCLDPPRQRRIDEIVTVLLRTLPERRYPFQVAIVDHPMVNAFATPGGFIVIFRGLLDRTENAEELAGVLAHEIQHVLHRHATRAILRHASTGVLLAALLGDVSGVVAFGAETARALGDLRHSREAEHEADRDGMLMLHAARIDPQGMLAFFQAMQRTEGTSGTAVRYLSTHPPAGDRLQALATLAAQGSHPTIKLLPTYDWTDIRQLCASHHR
ncbi:MAG TPA: M48 family metallopeptidase [Methylomirabilota bacterium]|nr:M48 family metallopeptidase [Methylomirabilota bacterium]